MPSSFEAEFSAHVSTALEAWTRARPANDFGAALRIQEKGLDLSRQFADFLPGYEDSADPLLDVAGEGMTVSAVRAFFSDLHTRPLFGSLCGREA